MQFAEAGYDMLAVNYTTETKPKTGRRILDHQKILRKRCYQRIRRGQHILFSLLALIVLAIPMGVVALIIWIDSPGASPIFSQDRVGRDGKIFKFYKFRSMVPNAEAKLHEKWTDLSSR